MVEKIWDDDLTAAERTLLLLAAYKGEARRLQGYEAGVLWYRLPSDLRRALRNVNWAMVLDRNVG
jgi:hypothetical protein